MTPEQSQALAEAGELQVAIDKLQGRQDRLLKPIAHEAIEQDDPDYTLHLTRVFPRGFYRSQLRTQHINRLEEDDYRQRLTLDS